MTLARLLAERRGYRNVAALPRLTESKILGWIQRWHRETGTWPKIHGGSIPNTNGETWAHLHRALVSGYRGLTGGRSLAQLVRVVRARVQ
jgi:hypothetical protein